MDELTPQELEEVAAALRELERSLAAALDSSAERAAPVDLDQPIGRVSRIDAIQQQQMAQAGRRLQERRLAMARAALKRLAAGEFGDCAHCDMPIGYARLRARPEAPFCIECQAEFEAGR